ncbi:MAG: GGDEF domain-containing phosphodiesterase [Saccharofermentans sp.]|nr:GGDEF domain-containing phosphodiesterase [Saccharofermentans sp.]
MGVDIFAPAELTASLEAFDGIRFSGESFSSICDRLSISKIEDFVYADGKLIKRTVSYISGDSDPEYIDNNIECVDGVNIVIRYYRKNFAPVNDESINDLTFLFCKTVSDCIALARVKELFGNMRYINPDTGLHNLNYFHKELRKILASEDRFMFSCAFISLKGFNQLNRFFGSDITGKAIKMFAQKLEEFVNDDSGEFAVHVGGDNFVVVIHSTKIESLKTFLSAVQVTLESDGESFSHIVSARAGITNIMPRHVNSNDVLGECSITLQIARRGTEDFVMFSEMDAAHDNQKNIAKTISRAVDENKFLIYYQPVVETNGRPTLFEAEALARWPRDGRITAPDEFINYARNSGIVTKIDFHVLGKVCEAVKAWSDAGYELVPLTCNFASKNLFNSSLASDIIDIIDSHGVDRKLIGIEFSEPDFKGGRRLLTNAAQELSEKGVKVTIDKFGLGRSSLDLLQDLKADYLKFDFGQLSLDDPRGSIIVKDMINLAEMLGFTVICKGVRTREDANELMLSGCTHFQSFIYDKPLSERFFERRLKNPVYTD